MAGGVDLDWLCGVVARHAPAFFLHPADRFMPCTAEFFLQHSELRAEVDGRSALLLPQGSVAAPLLLEAQRAVPPGCRLWLNLDPAARRGMPQEALDDVPIFAHPKLILGPDGCTVEALELTYITLYAHNGAYRVGGVGLIKTGDHDGDWEHCTARVHPTTGELLGMWYNAHRCRDGCWVAGPQVPRDPQTGRVAAYVALHGHGTYPRPGRVLRHFFLGNDLCSGAGPVWRPRRVVLLPPLHREAEAAAAGEALAPIGATDCHGSVRLDDAPAEQQGDEGQADSLEAGLGALSLAGQHAAEDGRAAPGGSGSGSGYVSSGRPVRRLGSRSLLQVPSRGSSLSSTSADGVVPAANGGAPAANSGCSGSSVPEVVVDDPCEWMFFRGDWGTIEAPIRQAWFSRAEPPVSRTSLLRIFGHFVPEPS
ncbi:hypothetical protein CHLNCDRAFT_133315 [Chlorella variabilis]|uniref:Uncharacterized protein n=1 Tax=Chlorella variabilis TaxID=554065 RepID=E1Z2U8_CHLVA|nr:hypothetical protein CHLNCDRAFT_133315 [Chlorella variabilis]EFN60057.1 hypothetical protein CHLNCDRAFT_133315 [Chlorella variabilis]|eukprot:XP_005852159.1 hypothetical protein CHLNCDRAFT_133315 [Chlorella variabilis]